MTVDEQRFWKIPSIIIIIKFYSICLKLKIEHLLMLVVLLFHSYLIHCSTKAKKIEKMPNFT